MTRRPTPDTDRSDVTIDATDDVCCTKCGTSDPTYIHGRE